MKVELMSALNKVLHSHHSFKEKSGKDYEESISQGLMRPTTEIEEIARLVESEKSLTFRQYTLLCEVIRFGGN